MGIIFSILSPAFYSINNYTDKFILEKYKINSTVISIFSGCVAVIASLLILGIMGFHLLESRTIAVIILSGILTELIFLPYFKALSLDEASRVIPLFQLTPVIVLLLGFFLLGERLASLQYVGALLIISGAFFLSVEKPQKRLFKLRKAFWYMVLASFMGALALILFKFGLDTVDFWYALPYEGMGIFIGSAIILSYRNNFAIVKKAYKRLPKRVFAYMTINEIIFILSRYMAFYALAFIPASLVSTFGGFQPIFILIYGTILSLWFPHILKEGITKKTMTVKLLAILVICLGIYLIFI